MTTNIERLKYIEDRLRAMLYLHHRAGNTQPVAELAEMRAKIEEKIKQFEEADKLLNEAVDVLRKHAPFAGGAGV